MYIWILYIHHTLKTHKQNHGQLYKFVQKYLIGSISF